MGKRPEEEIRKKLIELELSIKDEESKKQVPAAASTGSTQLSTTAGHQIADSKSVGELKTEIDLQALGGWACVVFSAVMFLSHITVQDPRNNFWPMGPMGSGASPIALLLVPLLVGFAMLFYNYKSRIAQLVTVGSLVAIILTTLLRLQPIFMPMNFLDFVIMLVPLSLGGALLAKAHFKRTELEDKSRIGK